MPLPSQATAMIKFTKTYSQFNTLFFFDSLVLLAHEFEKFVCFFGRYLMRLVVVPW